MRIVFVHQDHCLYGASRSLLSLLEQMKRRGHTCMVLLPRDGLITRVLEEREIEYAITRWKGWMSPERFSRPRRWLSACKGLVLNLRYVGRAASICKPFGADLVHTNCSRTAFGSLLARRLRVPHTWHFREFLGGVYSGGHEFSLGPAASCAWIRRSSSAVVLVSEVLRSQFIKRFGRTPSYVVHNGVMSLEEMEHAVVPLPAYTPLTLALVGRFDLRKDPMVALEAMRLLRDEGANVKLLIAGDGLENDVHAVKTYVQAHNLDANIEVLGFVHDLAALYARCHALLMPSLCDAFGRVTAESMAYGRPVLGANAGATPELITHEFNGLLFRSGDAKDLASQIRRLLQNPDLLEQMSRNAAETARERFTTDKYGEAMEKIFQSVIESNGATGR